MFHSTDDFFDIKPIDFLFKSLFVIGFGGGIFNIITRMEFLQTSVVIGSGILGMIYVGFKIYKIKMEIINENEKRVAEGKKPIRFMRAWKRKSKK